MKELLTFRNILIVLLVLLTIVFIAQNAVVVEVTLWFWTVSTPRSVVIIVSLLIGVVIGVVASSGWFRKRIKPDSEEYAEEPME